MANSRKYAGLLPDLDEDQDLFETPELTDDTSTRPTESVEDEDEEEDTDDEGQTSGISRHRLDADSARSQFTSTKVDTRRADFSDRLDSKRRSYRVSTRRKAAHGDGEEVSDGEDATPKDGLKRKIAALLKEAEELKAEAQRQQDTAQKAEEQPDGDTLKQLSSAVSILEALGPSAGGLGAETRLAKQLSAATGLGQDDATPSEKDVRAAPTYTLAYQPSFDDQHAHSLAASFDTRLKELETALGLASIPLPTQSERTPKPLLPTLDSLEKQVAVLAATTPASLDTMSKRIRQLTDEADRLDARRRAAKQSYAELRAAAADAASTMPPSGTSNPLMMEDAEMETKVAALYQTLPTIESLAPSLPAVLERLKSLRLLHADAADAATRVQQVETQSKETRDEVAMWRQALDKMEAAVAASEQTTKTNMATVEGWVRELEERAAKLKAGP